MRIPGVVHHLLQALGECAQEYEQFYVPELQAKQQAKVDQERARQEKVMAKLRKDMASKAAISKAGAAAAAAAAAAGAAGGGSLAQQQQGVDEDEEGESAEFELSDDSIEGSVGAASE
jgi:ribosomal protein L12E/L44/L45/RPP1/RPP2